MWALQTVSLLLYHTTLVMLSSTWLVYSNPACIVTGSGCLNSTIPAFPQPSTITPFPILHPLIVLFPEPSLHALSGNALPPYVWDRTNSSRVNHHAALWGAVLPVPLWHSTACWLCIPFPCHLPVDEQSSGVKHWGIRGKPAHCSKWRQAPKPYRSDQRPQMKLYGTHYTICVGIGGVWGCCRGIDKMVEKHLPTRVFSTFSWLLFKEIFFFLSRL